MGKGVKERSPAYSFFAEAAGQNHTVNLLQIGRQAQRSASGVLVGNTEPRCLK